jgi:C-methyltransferase C-terminal domain
LNEPLKAALQGRDTHVAPIAKSQCTSQVGFAALLKYSSDEVPNERTMFALAKIRGAGNRMYGIGAPARSTTLIHYFDLDVGVMECGHYIPGTRIPVFAEQRVEDQPSHALLLSWHIADELIGILRRKGYIGSFIVPLPEPRLIQ